MQRNWLAIFTFVFGITAALSAQEVKSKYPCRSEITYDVLVGGASYSGTAMDRRYELQNIINAASNPKQINGRYSIKFVVGCDGVTSEFEDEFLGNTLNDKMVQEYMQNLAKGINWNPAVHREERVPHRISISVEVRKGRIKSFKLP